jgi:hypothetical protein
MPELFRALEDNFATLFAFCVLWVVLWSAYFAWRRYKKGPIYPPFSDADIQFSEQFASGFSHKNLFTRFGGAHNALVVKVLRDAVLIEPLAVFKWLMPVGFNDLEHYVAKSQILRVEPASSFGKATVRFEFRASDGAPRTLELALRKPAEFLAALKA